MEHFQQGKLEMESENLKPDVDQVDRESHSEAEKAMHEGFMREALAMVHQAPFATVPPHHPQIT
jgi:hypothetical protein